MTVAELIEVLKTMPQDAVATVRDDDGDVASIKLDDVSFQEDTQVWMRDTMKFEYRSIVSLC